MRRHSMRDGVTIDHCFVIFYLFCQFIYHLPLSVFLIKLKYKLLYYNKATSLCHRKNRDCTKV